MLRFGVYGYQNDDITGFEIIDAAVSGTLAFLNVTVLEAYLEDGQADPRHLIAGQLTRQQIIYEWLYVGAYGTVLLGKCAQVSLELEGKRYTDGLTGHQFPSTVPKPAEYFLPAPPSCLAGYFQQQV